MKLLTLNTHSLHEKNYPAKLNQFIKYVLQVRPDIIAMQEVNQTITAPEADSDLLIGFHPCDNEQVPIRSDNHAAQCAKLLRESGLSCSWSWISSKIGYDAYNEGESVISIGSDNQITSVESFYISTIRDYDNWKTRRVLGVQTSKCKDWFFTVHMGWWQDEEEPFIEQWKRFNNILQTKMHASTNEVIKTEINHNASVPHACLNSDSVHYSNDSSIVSENTSSKVDANANLKSPSNISSCVSSKVDVNDKMNESLNVWLLGDFNSPAEVRNEGYDCMAKSGWNDTYELAEEKDEGVTVKGKIDGWRESEKSCDISKGMRIDQIWCSNPVKVRSSKVAFDGINGPVVSDHFGILVCT